MTLTVRSSCLGVIVVCAAILAVLPASRSHAQSAGVAPAAGKLTQLLKDFLAGASRNDVAAHERFWADDLIYTRSAGVRVGKTEILANARSGPGATTAIPTEYSAEDIRIQQYGETAVVAFRLVEKTGGGEQVDVMHFLNTGTRPRPASSPWCGRKKTGSGGWPRALSYDHQLTE